MRAYETLFKDYITAQMTTDVAHDLQHVQRVVNMAKRLCHAEQACIQIVVPAAWLHDCISLAKDHPQRCESSRLVADKAIEYLSAIGYPSQYLDAIHHAIVAHSFSAGVTPKSLEAKIVQDADRLDALGAIGISRCIQVCTVLARPLYHEADPFCQNRTPDDSRYTLDHFYRKLLTLADTMQTPSATAEACQRTRIMQEFLVQLAGELAG